MTFPEKSYRQRQPESWLASPRMPLQHQLPNNVFYDRYNGSLNKQKDSNGVYQQKDDFYYAKCLAGGALSSSVRWVFTPIDFIKTASQANPNRYTSFANGLSVVFREQGVSGLYRGLTPTVLAYSTQSGTKYATYEFLKYNLQENLDSEFAARHKSLIYMISAGCAEAVADVLMCPWEMLKVKLQTSHFGEFPSHFRPALATMIRRRREYGFPFGSLKPLWTRQIIGTVTNFVTFEHTVNGIYHHILNTHNKNDYSATTQLAVTFAAGFVSGTAATIVSHPADSLLSLQARYPDKTPREIVQLVGWKNLATQGLVPRVALTGTTIALQWFLYDSFKSAFGLGTTGGTD
ncbi:mitochondrial carrier protein [Nitzschia inconspicua]|uniref:Mitochondrial carrier protein n=1 Tax=Nitzschia inconspicua TaxID=303405 RepID=A0A9K3LBA0_9STRA|nr:mitochondrial carrier protein [Nitzschia inconspicua]